ncbi:MAG: dihydrolipoyllysine-residue succinyltransferase [Candidatus Algichlamydia australiensis]|nr:dihydrolipoyllysine-residue succinyltransferase [Chlamydiales bacterium]
MKVKIKVPPAGESVTEAQIASIIRESGSFVEKDAEILEIETEKVNQVLHAPASGTLELSVAVGDTVQIGQVVGTVDSEGSAAPAPAKPKKEEAEAPAAAPAPKAEGPSARLTGDDYLQNLGKQEKTKPAPAPTPQPAPAPKVEGAQTRKKMSGLRKTIAKRLVEAKNQTAMLTTFNEVDMQNVIEIRAKEKENFEKQHGVRLGFMSFFAKACVQALKAFPEINAYLEGDEIVYNNSYNLSFAVSTEKGLMVPVLRNCENLSFAEIEKGIAEYAKKAREGKMGIDELKGGTFTITNAGKFGSLCSTPILNPPQSAILGMHNIVKRPVVIDDEIVIRPMMYLALSYDHRIVDGEQAVSFLMHIRKNLEEPARLMLDF